MTDEQMSIPEFTDEDVREPKFHDFNKESEIIGKLVAVEQGTFGEQYKVKTEEGEVTIGTYGVLQSKISKEDAGKYVKIVCKGDVVSPKTKRTYKDFEVSVKD